MLSVFLYASASPAGRRRSAPWQPSAACRGVPRTGPPGAKSQRDAVQNSLAFLIAREDCLHTLWRLIWCNAAIQINGEEVCSWCLAACALQTSLSLLVSLGTEREQNVPFAHVKGVCSPDCMVLTGHVLPWLSDGAAIPLEPAVTGQRFLCSCEAVRDLHRALGAS